MKTQPKLLLAALGAAALAGGLVVWRELREPVFNGEPLSYWMGQLDGDRAEQAHFAIREIGAPGVPWLLRKVRQENARDGGSGLLNGFGRVPPGARPRDEALKAKVEVALVWIGYPAVAGLVKALRDPNDDVRLMALRVIRTFRPTPDAAVAGVIRLLHDPNEMIRFEAVGSCRKMGPRRPEAVPGLVGALNDRGVGHPGSTVHVRELAAQVLGTMGPTARMAAPQLARLSHDTNAYTRQQATLALWKITGDTNLVAQVVAELDKAPDPKTFKRFLSVLAEMGPPARTAVPVILRATTNRSAAMSEPVRQALLRIDSKAAANLEQRGR